MMYDVRWAHQPRPQIGQLLEANRARRCSNRTSPSMLGVLGHLERVGCGFSAAFIQDFLLALLAQARLEARALGPRHHCVFCALRSADVSDVCSHRWGTTPGRDRTPVANRAARMMHGIMLKCNVKYNGRSFTTSPCHRLLYNVLYMHSTL